MSANLAWSPVLSQLLSRLFIIVCPAMSICHQWHIHHVVHNHQGLRHSFTTDSGFPAGLDLKAQGNIRQARVESIPRLIHPPSSTESHGQR